MPSKQKLVRISLTLPDGTRKYYSGKTLKEAEAKRDKDKILIAGGWDISDDLTFETLAESWLEEYKSRGLHKRSVETTEAILTRYLLPILGPSRVRNIKPMHIDSLLRRYSHLSRSTQSKILSVANQIFEKAVENEIIPRSPAHNKKPTAKAAEEVLPLTNDQCSALLQATKGTRVYPFIMVLLYCGLRKGEALGLMWSDINFSTGMLTVSRSIVYPVGNRNGEINQEMKTSAAHRIIPMSKEVQEVLLEERKHSTSLYVFSSKNGSYLTESSFKRMWELISYRTIGGPNTSKRVKQTLNFSVHPHQLRHTCCTAWIYSGMNPKEVQYLMGHATSDVTMNVYAHYVAQVQLEGTAKKVQTLDRGIKIG